MKNKFTFLQLLLAGLTSSAVLAGTPNIAGSYRGSYQLTVLNSFSQRLNYQIHSQSPTEMSGWTWNFDHQTVTIDDGSVSSPDQPLLPFDYSTTVIGASGKAIPLIDNGDGTYRVDYHFKVNYPTLGKPEFNTFAVFDITRSGDNLAIKSLHADSKGTRITPSIPLNIFPFGDRQYWNGSATAHYVINK